MPRYIDADKLEDALYDNEWQTLCPLDEVSGVIDCLVTEDVAPVRHGRWKEGLWYMFCSKCEGMVQMRNGDKKQKFAFCPICGAKMDEEEQE